MVFPPPKEKHPRGFYAVDSKYASVNTYKMVDIFISYQNYGEPYLSFKLLLPMIL